MLTVNLSGSRCPSRLVFERRLSMTNSRALNSKVYLLGRAAHSLSAEINLSGLFFSRDSVSIISIAWLQEESRSLNFFFLFF